MTARRLVSVSLTPWRVIEFKAEITAALESFTKEALSAEVEDFRSFSLKSYTTCRDLILDTLYSFLP
jgi:hypothetical protein